MPKRVILVTGTPCIGKTSVANLLAAKLDALYINLTDLAVSENLVLGKDEKRDSIIIDETAMRRRISEIISECERKDVVVDGHYAATVVPKELVAYVFVLRRDPAELRKFMQRRGFSNGKLSENLASEILDVCLIDALNFQGEGKICELNATNKISREIVDEMLEIMSDQDKCCVGIVDWLGKLESEGLLDEFLKI